MRCGVGRVPRAKVAGKRHKNHHFGTDPAGESDSPTKYTIVEEFKQPIPFIGV
jgi:hypothetical protein